MQERFGDWLYYRILTGNRLLNFVRRRFGLRYWSLSEFLKRRAARPSATSTASCRRVSTTRAGAASTALSAATSIAPRCSSATACVYANDGDWVESLTALAEDPDGTLRLLSHRGETRALLPPRRIPLSPEPAVPQAA